MLDYRTASIQSLSGFPRGSKKLFFSKSFPINSDPFFTLNFKITGKILILFNLSLKEIMEKYFEDNPRKIGAIAPDSASNMCGALAILRGWYPWILLFGCITHKIHRLFLDCLKAHWVNRLLIQTRVVVHVFTR